MANTSRALLESALRARHLDSTLITPHQESEAVVPSGVAVVDAVLAGGLPRGALSVIAGPRSSGRTMLLLQVLGAATRQGEWVALIDTFDRADPASIEHAGVVRERVLWIRGQTVTGAPGRAADRAVARAIRAWHLVLQAGGFGVAALDLADVPPTVLARIPLTTWLRVQRVLEGGDTAGVVLAPRPVARSAGGLAVLLDGTSRWTGAEGSCRFEGLEVHVRARSPRHWPADEAVITARLGGVP
jgi:hypothetical protein